MFLKKDGNADLIDALFSLSLIDNIESCAEYDSDVSRYFNNPMHLQVTIYIHFLIFLSTQKQISNNISKTTGNISTKHSTKEPCISPMSVR